jgi:hypothetical protein
MRARPYSKCIEVLRFAGFRVLEHAAIGTCLRRGNRSVVVPNAAELPEDVFAAILTAAGMTEAMFEALLDIASDYPPTSSRRPANLSVP